MASLVMKKQLKSPTILGRLKSLPIDRTLFLALLSLLILGLIAIFAQALSPSDPNEQNIRETLKPPTLFFNGYSEYPMGTDQVGRDILSNVFFGIRISMTVGLIATAIALTIGLILGLVAGFFREWLDNVIMRLVDLQLSIPTELIALFAMAVLGQGLWKLIIVIGISEWASYARTVRGSILSEREREYVDAARAIGMKEQRILIRHILPNVVTPLAILVAVQIPRVIMLEATLSFLGIGIPVTTPSLGLTISRGFDVLFSGSWWTVMFPGLALLVITYSINTIADSLRDFLDPRYSKA